MPVVRTRSSATDFSVAGWQVRPEHNEISRDDLCVRLEPRVMDLLVYLASRPGELVSKERLIEDVWDGAHVGDDALMTAVAALRRAVSDSARNPEFIETVPKRGYRLIAPVRGTSVALAVLPLDNLSGDPDEEFFADGMTDALIAALGSNRQHLRVISRTSSMRFKRSELSLPDIAEELGVDLVIEGSVLRHDDDVRITVQLIDSRTDSHLWAQVYQRPMGDVLALQSQVAHDVDQEIRHELGLAEVDQPGSLPVEPSSFLEYLKGRSELRGFDSASFGRALSFFQRALERDPNSPFPYIGLSLAWGWHANWGLVSGLEAGVEMARANAKALELGATLSTTHVIAGKSAYYNDRNWESAERAYARALELNPNNSTALWSLSHVLATTDRTEEALELGLRAVALDPLNALTQSVVAWHLLRLGRSSEAFDYARKANELDQAMPPSRLSLWTGLAAEEKPSSALEQASTYFAVTGRDDISTLISESDDAYPATMGRAARALATCRRHGYVQPSQIARLFTQAQELQRAIEWLEVGVQECDPFLVHLGMPEWNRLREIPAFEDLLSRVGLRTHAAGGPVAC